LNLRHWMERLISAGARVALPVVVARATPLVFRPWTTDCEMEQGVWKIPVPVDGPEVTPDILLTPLVGWDEAAFRLGHGGDGYFDRTLAALAARPLVIGVGLVATRIPAIRP
jgi:5,10-methenyltetrahydrofolate synthetase